MRLPKAMRQILKEKEINEATAIQMQCLPASYIIPNFLSN